MRVLEKQGMMIKITSKNEHLYKLCNHCGTEFMAQHSRDKRCPACEGKDPGHSKRLEQFNLF
jgi:rubrerythrin